MTLNGEPPGQGVDLANRDADNAKHDHREFKIGVIYNGVTHHIEVRPHELVKKALHDAIHSFGNLPQPHMLALFLDGKELDDNLTVKASHIEPHTKLLLRPSAVRGGV